MAKAPPTIAATSTLAMVRAAEARGYPTIDLLEAAGLTHELLEAPDSRLPGPTVLGLWNALRERTGDPALQLAAPTSIPFGAYRIIDYLVAASATVGEGVRRFAGFFGLIADAVRLAIEEDGAGPTLSLAMADGRAVPPVYVDYVFAALVSRIRMRIRPGLRLRQLELRQAEPASIVAYHVTFQSPIHFGAAVDRLGFSREEWEAPTDTADAALARMLEEHAGILARRIPRAAPGFVAEVEKAVASVVSEGGSAAQVSRALHVSVRTLQRRLVATGTTFREVSDSVRQQLAEAYLADRKVSIAEVAFLLGFSEQSSFSRAFRGWTGESPGHWRQRRG